MCFAHFAIVEVEKARGRFNEMQPSVKEQYVLGVLQTSYHAISKKVIMRIDCRPVCHSFWRHYYGVEGDIWKSAKKKFIERNNFLV